MSKRGFTLIELLAVIVILAIIALIAVPIVLNMIENARRSAAKSSAYGYIEAINNNNELAGMKNNDMDNIPNRIDDGTYEDVTEIEIKIKGKKPTSGTLTITNGRVVNAHLCINKYTINYENNEATVGEKCSGIPTPHYPKIESCPGCNKYVYTNDPLYVGSKATGAVEDYTTLTEHPYFIGLITNSDNTIQRAFSCGIENGTPFCIEGINASMYSTNDSTIKKLFSCRTNANNTYCGGITVNAQAFNYGDVVISGPGGECWVYSSGEMYCGRW